MAVCARCGRYEAGHLCARCGAPTEPDVDAAAAAWPPQPAGPAHPATPTYVAAYQPVRQAPGPAYDPRYPPASYPPARAAGPAPGRARTGTLIAAGLAGAVVLVGAGALIGPRVADSLTGGGATVTPATSTRAPATITSRGAGTSAAAPPTVPTIAAAPAQTTTTQAALTWTPPAGLYSGLCVKSVNPSYWTANIALSGTRGTISYDSTKAKAQCTGTVAQRPDGAWLESIESGPCTKAGVWTFSPTATGLHGTYTPAGGDYVLTAELTLGT